MPTTTQAKVNLVSSFKPIEYRMADDDDLDCSVSMTATSVFSSITGNSDPMDDELHDYPINGLGGIVLGTIKDAKQPERKKDSIMAQKYSPELVLYAANENSSKSSSAEGKRIKSNENRPPIDELSMNPSNVSTITEDAGNFWNLDLEDILLNTESLTLSENLEKEKSDFDSLIQNLDIRKELNLSVKARLSAKAMGEAPKDALLNVATNKATSKKSVNFDQVQVRVYESILSVNPDCSAGPSLGIGWKFDVLKGMRINDWEIYRPSRRREKELVLSRGKREKIARKLGYSEREIVDNIRAVRIAKKNRQSTIDNLYLSKVEEKVEDSLQRIKKLFFFKK